VIMMQLAEAVVGDIHEAAGRFMRLLRRRFAENNIVILGEKILPANFGRHRLIIVTARNGGVRTYKFYLIYQRRWFESFQKYFGVPAEAASVNLSILERAVRHGYDRIVWVSQDGSMFWIDPREMKRIVEERGWIRKTRKTGEEVAHIPLDYLLRLG